MSYESILEELTKGLQAAGRENFSVASSDEAMVNIAKPIAKAIHDGSDFEIKGSATVAEIGAMQDVRPGDIWAMKDSGTVFNSDGTTLVVTAGDLIRWDGRKWSTLLHIDLTGYVKDEDLASSIAVVTASIAAVQASVTAHASRTDNPHQVTAAQVGAATLSDVSEAIGLHNGSDSAHSDIRDGLATEITDREGADAEIITSLEDETTARRLGDELLQQQIDEVAVQTDWEQGDATKLDYLKNKPIPITQADIDALFI